ncbi:MAG: acyl-CoA thioesterase [Crocinitomicaceae bacterium]
MEINPAKIQVRYVDLDVLGHVNNSVYFSYFEMARVHYFGQVLGKDWDWETSGVILVKNWADYLKPVLITDSPEISIFVDKIGTKSFDLSYELKVNDVLHTKGGSTMVAFDAKSGTTIQIPGEMQKFLEQLKRNNF